MYILFTIASFVLNLPYLKYVGKRLKEEGYNYPFNEKSLKEKIFNFIGIVSMFVLPIVHLITIINGMATFGNEKNREDFYQTLKESLVKHGIIVNGNMVKTDVKNVKIASSELKNEEQEIEEEKEIEPPINTYKDAQAYWYSKYEKPDVPTLPTMDELRQQEENGHQKKYGSR